MMACTGRGSSRSLFRHRENKVASCSTSNGRFRCKRPRPSRRFGPFLERAWGSRHDLPPDELNGVIPLDSKFGFAWRDWRVLSELAHRTHRDDFAKSAANIAQILSERAADMRLENLQDRIHRLYAWWLIDKIKYASKIKRETGALLSLQNADGGWHEVASGPGDSAIYTTGQLTWTLLKIGLPRDHPAVANALHYLLAQQQDFGGWFQTDTHENFRTPMRETRYAVMALAEAFPRAEAPRGDGVTATQARPACPALNRSFRSSTTWRISGTCPSQIALASPRPSRRCSNIPNRSVRAAAAACLGRLGQAQSTRALIGRLADPSKIVWRAAAWALRRLGNQGLGLDAIAAALKSRIPRPAAVPRGSLLINFTAWIPGSKFAESLIELTRDPDLWTRLQAMRSCASGSIARATDRWPVGSSIHTSHGWPSPMSRSSART